MEFFEAFLRDARLMAATGLLLLFILIGVVYQGAGWFTYLNPYVLHITDPVNGTYSVNSGNTVVSTGKIPATVSLATNYGYTVTVKNEIASITSIPTFNQMSVNFPDLPSLLKKANATQSMADLTNVAVAYEQGWGGTVEDYPNSLLWYQKAARQGSGAADMKAAFFFENGYGTTVDASQAYRFYHEAAVRGIADAQVKMGLFCKNGLPSARIQPNKSDAVAWFRKAAAQGNSDATMYLHAMGQ